MQCSTSGAGCSACGRLLPQGPRQACRLAACMQHLCTTPPLYHSTTAGPATTRTWYTPGGSSLTMVKSLPERCSVCLMDQLSKEPSTSTALPPWLPADGRGVAHGPAGSKCGAAALMTNKSAASADTASWAAAGAGLQPLELPWVAMPAWRSHLPQAQQLHTRVPACASNLQGSALWALLAACCTCDRGSTRSCVPLCCCTELPWLPCCATSHGLAPGSKQQLEAASWPRCWCWWAAFQAACTGCLVCSACAALAG
jgi:hypothetical protein